MSLLYYLTPAGDDAMFGKNGQADFPVEYRRLLGLIHSGGHLEVLRGRLRRFPDRMILEWLKELQELKLVQVHPAGEAEDITFTGRRMPPLPALPQEDSVRLAKNAAIAGATLVRSGSFIADERVANLACLHKAPHETRLLLVEDDPGQAILGELRLTLAGYQVRTVHCAKALSRSLREEERPDLLLLDVMLPDGDGFEILALLRSTPEFATLPIVLLTSKTEPADILKGLELGADGYVTKPYSKEQLTEVIGRILKHPVAVAA
jgi:CheY-like chemotaxis protein